MPISREALDDKQRSPSSTPFAASKIVEHLNPIDVELRFQLSPVGVGGALGVLALLLALLSVGGHAAQFFLGNDHFVEYVRIFNLGGEQNVPTWYTSILLFICASLLAYIATKQHARRLPYLAHWVGLAAIFLFLSMDAVAVLHDRTLESLLLARLQLRGLFFFPWVVVGWAFVIVFGLIYVRFLFHLSRNVRLLFVVAAMLYVGGGLVLEMVSVFLMDYYIDSSLLRGTVATVQEVLEMAGLIVFVTALLSHIGLQSDRNLRARAGQ